MSYKYYQPNKKDLKDNYGDCTIRALTKAMNVTWVEAFDLMVPICRRFQCSNIFNLPCKLENEAMKELGFEYHGISNKKGSRRPTVKEFAKKHKEGIFIANVAGHEVAIVDGTYYDTWDCGYKSLYGYYQKID